MFNPEQIALIRPSLNLAKPGAIEPISLEILAASLEQAGYPVTILDEAVQQVSPHILEPYHIYGISADTVQYPRSLEIFDMIRSLDIGISKHIQRLVHLGGAHASAIGEPLLKDGWTSVCVGEADLTIADIVGQHLSGIVRAQTPVDLNALPYPARHLTQDHQYGKDDHPSISILTSRGCPYSCIYCYKGVSGKKVRFRSPQNVLDEIIEAQRQFPFQTVHFYDDTFNLQQKRAIQISQGMEQTGLNWTCNARVNCISKELLQAMKQGNCTSISLGMESGSEHVLNSIDKRITPEMVIDSTHKVRDAGIQARLYVMFGLPEESFESVEKTLNVIAAADPDTVQVSFAVPFPGSQYYARANEFGIELPEDLKQYYYIGPEGPHTFVRHTNHLDETQFIAARDQLLQGVLEWSTHHDDRVRTTNVQSFRLVH